MDREQRHSRTLQYQLAGSSAHRAGEASARPGAKVVLVVDDDPAITRMIDAVAGTLAATTLAAYDGLQGMVVAQREHPDLILVDLHMPAGGGIKLLEKLKASAKTAETPVLFFTADTAADLPERVAALGARGFLRKPLDPAVLEATLRTLLQGPPATPSR